MATPAETLTVQDLGLTGEDEEALDVLDLPQLYTKPTAPTLLLTLEDLSSEPPSWETTPRTGTPRSGTPRSLSGTSTPFRRRPKIRSEGVPRYLTKIISSPLAWIKDDDEKEKVWEAASARLSERSGRTAMGAITRSFAIPVSPVVELPEGPEVLSTEQALAVNLDEVVELVVHEPALTADNLGFKTWASSYLLAKRLALMSSTLPALPPEASILELGAGTGLVGMAAAAAFSRHVVLTDLPDIVPNLEKNARSNVSVISSHSGSTTATVLDWSAPSSLHLSRISEPHPPHTFPLILAADPIYSPEQPALLVNAMDYHLSRGEDAIVVVAIPIREAFAAEREDFRVRMADAGLAIRGQGEEVGVDDWGSAGSEELTEVRCWWSVWGWKERSGC